MYMCIHTYIYNERKKQTNKQRKKRKKEGREGKKKERKTDRGVGKGGKDKYTDIS